MAVTAKKNGKAGSKSGAAAEISLNARQKKALVYFRENLDGWLLNPQYKYKYAVIRGNALVGAFDTFRAALAAAAKCPRIDFVIQQVIPAEDAVECLYPVSA